MTQKFHDLVAGARSYRRFDQSKKMTMHATQVTEHAFSIIS